MMYALERDVVKHDGGEWIQGLECPGRVKLREGKRPRPLVLRGNVGDTLEITFTNLLLEDQPDLSSCELIDDASPYRNLLEAAPRGRTRRRSGGNASQRQSGQRLAFDPHRFDYDSGDAPR